MDNKEDQRATSLADACVDLSTEERPKYLNRECGDDGELGRKVERCYRLTDNTRIFQ